MRKLIAVLLAVIWPAVTSHSFLEGLELIHVVHEEHHHDHGDGDSHEHEADNHQFADGDYIVPSAAKSLCKPVLSPLRASSAVFVVFPITLDLTETPGPAPPWAAPPLLQKSWHFSLRAALPARAPSFIC